MTPGSEYPLGREPGGRYRITGHLYGTVDRGCYRGVRLLDGEPVLLTLGSPQTLPRRELEDALRLTGPHIAPLLETLELVEPNETPASVLVEDAPGGVPLATIPFPLPLREAVALGIAIAGSLERAHADRQVLRGIRPELVYVAADRALTGLVPRCERFWSLAPSPCYGVAPTWDLLYLSPELIANRDIGPPSDVFSLCVLLATIASGEHPFPAGSLIEQLSAITTGKRRPWTGPPALATLLDAGLAVDPAARPGAARVRESLERELAGLRAR